MNKIIVIEGTDSSGKETQQKLIAKRLSSLYKVESMSFPNYDSATGLILGASYLGKPHLTSKYLVNNEGFFKETAGLVDPYVASLYYAADRRYALPILESKIKNSDILFLDRYVYSNMAHQAGRLDNKKDRHIMYKYLYNLEFNVLKLPKPDLVILLYVPYEFSNKLNKQREELPDELEKDKNHLLKAEKAYLELAKIYDFKIINCIKDNKLRTIEDINDDIYNIIEKSLYDK